MSETAFKRGDLFINIPSGILSESQSLPERFGHFRICPATAAAALCGKKAAPSLGPS